MTAEGPPLEALLHRLSECPPEFWETCAGDPRRSSEGLDQVRAIVCDQFRSMQPDFDAAKLAGKLAVQTSNHGGLLAVVAWLLNDAWFVSRGKLLGPMQKLFCSPQLEQLSSMLKAEQFVQDPDRREELVRICLSQLKLRPEGESEAQAADRLATLDSIERERILKKTLAAEKRAREVREAMAQARAQESASRYGE
ncbi:MAG: hypothetical protein ACTHK7_04790 [Aureliella sp.]